MNQKYKKKKKFKMSLRTAGILSIVGVVILCCLFMPRLGFSIGDRTRLLQWEAKEREAAVVREEKLLEFVEKLEMVSGNYDKTIAVDMQNSGVTDIFYLADINVENNILMRELNYLREAGGIPSNFPLEDFEQESEVFQRSCLLMDKSQPSHFFIVREYAIRKFDDDGTYMEVFGRIDEESEKIISIQIVYSWLERLDVKQLAEGMAEYWGIESVQIVEETGAEKEYDPLTETSISTEASTIAEASVGKNVSNGMEYYGIVDVGNTEEQKCAIVFQNGEKEISYELCIERYLQFEHSLISYGVME